MIVSRAMKWLGLATVLACGGTTSIDAGTDGSPNDSGVIPVDAAECTPPNTTCANPCPAGTFCLVSNGPTPHDLGCTTIPPECNGTPSCSCMADCFCPPVGVNKCTATASALTCDNGTVSRREYKKDIAYVCDARRSALAEQALSTSLTDRPDDLYAYTSMLLATVQQQQREIDALQEQIASLRVEH